MLKLLVLSTLQCLMLVTSQIFLKFAMARMGSFEFSWTYFKALLCNLPLAASGIAIACATILWMYILKHFEFSVAYPLISISYIFGLLAAVFIFHEAVPAVRWFGVAFIMVGVYFIVK